MTINSRSAKLSSPNVKIQDVPNVPTIGTPAQGVNDISVPFTPATTGGRAAIYRAVSNPDNIEAISYGSSPISVSGLSGNTQYTFTVRGETATGATTGYSSASSPITTSFSNMELISTTLVGSGGTSSVTFSSLPTTYKHLQIRAVIRDQTAATGTSGIWIRMNGDTGNNYAWHRLRGYGSGINSESSSSTNQILAGVGCRNNETANIFGTAIIDILDFNSTGKNKTIRSLSGNPATANTPEIELNSGVWFSTAAITSLVVYGDGGFVQNCRISLYGIRG